MNPRPPLESNDLQVVGGSQMLGLVSISLEGIVLARGSQTLVDGLSTVIASGDRVGLFGPN